MKNKNQIEETEQTDKEKKECTKGAESHCQYASTEICKCNCEGENHKKK